MNRKLIAFLSILVMLAGICFSAMANGTYDTATEVRFGTEYQDANQEGDDPAYPARCWYKLTLDKSGKVSVQYDAVRSTAYGAFYLELYNDKVEKMATFSHNFNTVTNEVMGTDSVFLKAGTYYFCIYGKSSGWYPVYTFTLTFTHEVTNETIPESTTDSNDTYGTATGITLAKDYTEQISYYGDTVDHYKFTLAKAQDLQLWSKAFMEKIQITIKDSQGNQKWASAPEWNSFVGYSEKTDEISLTAGTYYLDFESTKDSKRYYTSGIYQFKLSVALKDTVTSGGLKYKLDHNKKTATVLGPAKKTVKKITIPQTVKANKQTYQVTAIGKNAFNGCKKLATITIKTTKLTRKTIGKNCFKGIAAKAVFKCPKKMLKKYQTWLRSPGSAPKKAVFK